MANRPTREPGIITAGLCIVADTLSVHEAYHLAHHRDHIENIKVRPRSYLTRTGDDLDLLRYGDFHVICDAKFDFTRIDEAVDTLGLFGRSGLMPDAVTYSRAVGAQVMSVLVEKMLDADAKDVISTHTIVLTGILPEQRVASRERIDVLKERMELAHRLQGLGARVAAYAAVTDFSRVDVPDGVMTIGAGVRMMSDLESGYMDFDLAESSSAADILLVGSVMGDDQKLREAYLDDIAPRDKDHRI